ncbi:pathogenesis-related thaumatin-like protein 3.5 [Magnolia sinica]|uniref:pathogenesis-related thaumatin-like protein 3.5 n=1 Tax=Magnolia sinica TaxID=86752 RepID=UPI002657ED3A|nr:pathogenesis-related thaumatin-like protein 3.5 [Magnolia sinica]
MVYIRPPRIPPHAYIFRGHAPPFSVTNCNKSMEMATLTNTFLIIFLILITSGAKPSESARIFTMTNDCKETIWPAIIPGENFGGGGFELKPKQSIVFTAPVGWSGRIWGRTGCNFDKTGTGPCQTGSCGDAIKCGASGKTPATLAEFTLASPDFYDVSMVDGFNLPLVVTPLNGKGNCSAAGCDGDLNKKCPKKLAVKAGGKTVGCRSACDVFGSDEYCCKGVFGNPTTCQPSTYSKLFKAACPAAYSYAYDDHTSLFTCSSSDYIITFCASRKKTVCTYHDNKVVCNGSDGSKSPTLKWLAVMLFYALITSWAIS